MWECPRCGAESLRSDGERPELKEEKPARTHWDMLRERRSIAELEELLAETVEPAAFGRVGLDRILAKHATEEDRVILTAASVGIARQLK